ncbi:MAG TPA: anthranilate synthase component I, partial [Rhodobacter sp.]|nr:anthranilate synthase component I [Rhodobacter sp.]
MALTSDFETFERGWAKGENQVVYTRLAADLDTPVSLMLKLAAVDTNSFMLESVTGGELR